MMKFHLICFNRHSDDGIQSTRRGHQAALQDSSIKVDSFLVQFHLSMERHYFTGYKQGNLT
jgi:hypothetical protein